MRQCVCGDVCLSRAFVVVVGRIKWNCCAGEARCDARWWFFGGGLVCLGVCGERAKYGCCCAGLNIPNILCVRFWTLDKSRPLRRVAEHTDIPYNKWKIRKTYSKLCERAFGCSVHLIQASDARRNSAAFAVGACGADGGVGGSSGVVLWLPNIRIWGYPLLLLRSHFVPVVGPTARHIVHIFCVCLAFGYVVLTLAKTDSIIMICTCTILYVCVVVVRGMCALDRVPGKPWVREMDGI